MDKGDWLMAIVGVLAVTLVPLFLAVSLGKKDEQFQEFIRKQKDGAKYAVVEMSDMRKDGTIVLKLKRVN